MSRYIFISDVHLSSSAPEITEDLVRCLLRWTQEKIDGLYILGDLFNYWFGPQQALFPECHRVLSTLKNMHNQGVKIYFVFGNRDYLAGSYLEKTWNLRHLGEKAFIRLDGKVIYLTHGDLYLINDKVSLIFRKALQHPIIRGMAVIVPPRLVHFITRTIRNISKNKAPQRKPENYSLHFPTVLKSMFPSKYAICGHVHQAGLHTLYSSRGEKYLYTLGDWSEGPTYLELRDGEFLFNPE